MKDEYPSHELILHPAQIDAHFGVLQSRLENIPELQPALELAIMQPELVEAAYNDYAALIAGMAGLTNAERQTIGTAKAEILQTRGNFGTASEVSADELLAELDGRKEILAELVHSSIDPASPYMAPALDELVRRMEGGHRLKLSGKQPNDDDQESRKVIWGHTMITDPEALVHFISCHYLERYFAVGLTAQGSQLAQQKDFMLNALIDAVLVDHIGANKFAAIYEKWRMPKESGGLGWITDDRLASYQNNVKPELSAQEVAVTRAVSNEAETICEIRDRAWLEAYPNAELGITVDDVRLMAQGPDGEYVPRRVAYLKDQLGKEDGTSETTFVAKLDGNVVGFIDPRIDEKGHRRVGAIYVAPEAQGKGVGSKLMNQVLDWYGRDQDIYLEVVSYNQNAINFYKRFGFVQTDTEVAPEEGRPAYLKILPQIEMVLKAKGGQQ